MFIFQEEEEKRVSCILFIFWWYDSVNLFKIENISIVLIMQIWINFN